MSIYPCHLLFVVFRGVIMPLEKYHMAQKYHYHHKERNFYWHCRLKAWNKLAVVYRWPSLISKYPGEMMTKILNICKKNVYNTKYVYIRKTLIYLLQVDLEKNGVNPSIYHQSLVKLAEVHYLYLFWTDNVYQ